MELDAASISYSRSGGLIMHVNKVHHVTTINRVANDLGENEDWISDVANEMEVEDGVIWVYGVSEDGVMAFTDFGIENLIDLIKMYKKTRRCSSVSISKNDQPGGPRRMLTEFRRFWRRLSGNFARVVIFRRLETCRKRAKSPPNAGFSRTKCSLSLVERMAGWAGRDRFSFRF